MRTLHGALKMPLRNAAGDPMAVTVDVRPVGHAPYDADDADFAARCTAVATSGAPCVLAIAPRDVTSSASDGRVRLGDVDGLARWVRAWEGVYLVGLATAEPAPCEAPFIRALLRASPTIASQVAAGVQEWQNRYLQYSHN
jgi:hypothetical protein